MFKVRRALLSVYDKRGLLDLARALDRRGVEILSTGGTALALRDAGIPLVTVSDYTGSPEILEGRVKTLHPRIHGGLLGRPTPSHEKEMAEQSIAPIDLVAVNLYPFRETVARAGVTWGEAIENIDIGGPAMIRSAAKNHERVTVVVDPADYAAVIEELDRMGGVSLATRFRLAARAFAYTAAYDGAISAFLSAVPDAASLTATQTVPALERFPATLTVQARRTRALRYGENPHQEAAFYSVEEPASAGSATWEVFQGKELSYNNLLDVDAAFAAVAEYEKPAVVIIKHTNPCGVAVADSAAAAYRSARESDPVSAFGGIVAVNRPVDGDLGRDLSETFLEVVIAPGFEPEALEALGKKKNLRLVRMTAGPSPSATPWSLRSACGGLLVQTIDAPASQATRDEVTNARVVTRRQPTLAEREALLLSWRVAKHVRSNAIVIADDRRTLGIGAGQMSRVDSVRLAIEKALAPLAGSALASDAFFPFRDSIDTAAKAGVAAIVQPGGSVRDEEVIRAADEAGIAMIFTGQRHFRH